MHPFHLTAAGFGAGSETFVYIVGVGKAKRQTAKDKRNKNLTSQPTLAQLSDMGFFCTGIVKIMKF